MDTPALPTEASARHRRLGATVFFDACLGAFQGGGCRAAAYAGGVRRAEEAGVRFAELAGTSAGSIVAALLAAGASSSALEALVSQSPLSHLLAPPHKAVGLKRHLVHLAGRASRSQRLGDAVAYGGAYSTDRLREWLNDALRDLLPDAHHRVRFGDLLLPTWVVATDLEDRSVHVWSSDTTPDYEVAAAVAASCALPFFFQPVQDRYIDGGVLSNLPAFVYANRPRRTSDRVLAFTLAADPAGPRDRRAGPFSSTRRDVAALAETVVGGSTQLQLGLQPEVSVVEIPTGDVRATDFDRMTPDVTRRLVRAGYEATNKFFQQELYSIRSGPSRRREHVSRGETLSAVAGWVGEGVENIAITAADTRWVFDLFPALLHWRANGVPMRVLVAPPADTTSSQQQRVLADLGVEMRHRAGTDGALERVFLRNGEVHQSTVAVVGASVTGVDSVFYSAAAADGAVLSALKEQFEALWTDAAVPQGAATTPHLPQLTAFDERTLLDALRTGVPMYQHAHLSYATVSVQNLVPLAKTVPLHKYRQAAVWDALFTKHGLTAGQPAAVFTRRGPSVVGPVVVEASGDDLFLIQGTSRALRAKHAGAEELQCVVVEGVTEPLPAVPQDLRRLRVVVDDGGVDTRFPQFEYSRFRPIEQALRGLLPSATAGHATPLDRAASPAIGEAST